MKHFSWLERLLGRNHFFIIGAIFLSGIFYFSLFFQGRIPAGHDGFNYLAIRYFFANGAISSGHFPQWLPYLAHGVPSGWMFPVQCGFLQDILPFLTKFFQRGDYLPFFYGDLFLKEVIFIVGGWAWSGLFLKSRYARIFFVLASQTSLSWFTQPAFNFQLLYALPSIFFLFHKYLLTARPLVLFLFFEAIFFSIVGTGWYFAPFIGFLLFIYILVHCLSEKGTVKFWWKRVSTSPQGHIAALGLGSVSFITFFIFFRSAWEQLAIYPPGRSAEGISSLGSFLGYGGNLNFWKWMELFIPVSPELDYSLYSGMLIPFFIIFALVKASRKIGAILIVILILLSFSIGSATAVAAYYLFPLMKLFRHLALISPVIKIFICLVAAYGFEYFILSYMSRNDTQRRSVSRSLAGWFFIIAGILFVLGTAGITHLMSMTVPKTMAVQDFTFLWSSSLEIRLTCFILLACAASLVLIFWVSRKIAQPSFLVIFLLAVVVVDTTMYKVFESSLRTVSLARDDRKIFYFMDIPFHARRPHSLAYFERSRIFDRLPLQRVMYEESSLLAFAEEAGASFRLTVWSRSLDGYLRLFWGQDPFDRSVHPKGLRFYRDVLFPIKNKTFRISSGIDEDKIQFFQDAFVNDEQTISKMLLKDADVKDLYLFALTQHKPQLVSNDRRRYPPYTVTSFSSDRIDIMLNAPADSRYLFYSDAWHSSWTAFINGVPTRIFRADLAYKAVKLEDGNNKISFVFNDPLQEFFFRFMQWHSLLALIFCPVLLGYLSKKDRTADFKKPSKTG